jgi:hypothetical protein
VTIPFTKKTADGAARQAMFQLKKNAKITLEEIPTEKPETAIEEPKKKGGRPKTVYTCPCCEAQLSIEGKSLVDVKAKENAEVEAEVADA